MKKRPWTGVLILVSILGLGRLYGLGYITAGTFELILCSLVFYAVFIHQPNIEQELDV